MNKISTKKNLLILIAIVGLFISIYGYYQLLTIVPAMSNILVAFEANLPATTQFIIQTHNYYAVLSIIGLLAIVLVYLGKVNPLTFYLLVVTNLLVMLTVRLLISNDFKQSIFMIGLIN